MQFSEYILHLILCSELLKLFYKVTVQMKYILSEIFHMYIWDADLPVFIDNIYKGAIEAVTLQNESSEFRAGTGMAIWFHVLGIVFIDTRNIY